MLIRKKLIRKEKPMSFTIYVRMKKLGKQKGADLQPIPFELDTNPQTVRELLIVLTRLGVKQYNARKDEWQLLSYLTKITSGLRGGADAKEDQAIENTLQCFEDGIYRVFAGEQELAALSDMIPWTDDMIFTFIRLTMLSGW